MQKSSHGQGRARALVIGIVVFAAGTIAILWGWNTFAVGILGLPEIRLRHAVALEILILAVSAPLAALSLIRRDTTG